MVSGNMVRILKMKEWNSSIIIINIIKKVFNKLLSMFVIILFC